MSEGEATGPRTPADLAGQFRAAADRLMAGWTAAAGTAAGGTPSLPALPPMPATMSAEQLETFLDDLAARRGQVQALVTQLQLFDEQLGTLEASVRPFVEWTRTWVELERTMTQFWRPPSGTTGSPGSTGQ
jgi:hypothetical protein